MARTVPSVTPQRTGNLVSAQVWNSGVKTVNDFLSNRPAFKAVSTVGQSVGNNVWSFVQFDSGRLDTDGGHSPTVNNGRYTAQVAGVYWVKGSVGFGPLAAATSRVDTAIAKNSTIIIGSGMFAYRLTSNFASFGTSALVRMNVGDYVEIWVRQHSGVAVNLDNGGNFSPPDFSVIWIST